MGIGNILMLCQVTAYLLCAIFSFFVFAPMAVNKNNDFNGNCLLFPNGSVDPQTSVVTIKTWGSPGGCNFAITIGIVALLVSIAQLVRLSFHVFYETDSSFIGAFGTFIGNVIITVMVFISAINITEGYSAWCRLIEQAASSCSLAGFEENIWKKLKYIKPDNYAVELGMVQFGLWSEFLIWLFLSIFSIIKLIKYNQQESIIRSLSRERQRLLGHYRQPDF
ncbi:transmembrane protein 179-like [Asterias rubens]|uniref:transmembrane protein 179-like n=1 Tax=Asterias rubens TaxID=7604 RepID=UPI0014554609|nr:transmembrane protein 179-like [Asterias rubens]